MGFRLWGLGLRVPEGHASKILSLGLGLNPLKKLCTFGKHSCGNILCALMLLQLIHSNWNSCDKIVYAYSNAMI